MAIQPRMDSDCNLGPFQSLDTGVVQHILEKLAPRQVAAASSICKYFKDNCNSDPLWRAFYNRELHNVDKLLTHINPTKTSWKQRVETGLALRDFRVARWQEIHTEHQSRVRPCAREGHAAASWGQDSMILFGGWGSGIRNDLYILDRMDEGNFKWRYVTPSGRAPEIRYGHSVTRCGAGGDMLLVYGGMQSGGYTAEIEELAVLRPCTGSSSSSGGPSTSSGSPTVSQQYEWFHPDLKGASPKPRGYHAACASPDGRKVYLFGGMADDDCCNTLAVVDVETWECEIPSTEGQPPSNRFGCSMAVWDGGLWVVGGGCGHDLARSGHDLEDIYRLDLQTMTWSQPELRNQLHDARLIGRCHAYTLVGSKLVLFGGSLELGNQVTWLDLEQRMWGYPLVIGQKPGARMSAVMAVSGTDLLVYGGWIYHRGEMGDLHRLKLDLSDAERQQARKVAAKLADQATERAASKGRAALGETSSNGNYHAIAAEPAGPSTSQHAEAGPSDGVPPAANGSNAAAAAVSTTVPSDETESQGLLARLTEQHRAAMASRRPEERSRDHHHGAWDRFSFIPDADTVEACKRMRRLQQQHGRMEDERPAQWLQRLLGIQFINGHINNDDDDWEDDEDEDEDEQM